jgi:hypothetical protein
MPFYAVFHENRGEGDSNRTIVAIKSNLYQAVRDYHELSLEMTHALHNTVGGHVLIYMIKFDLPIDISDTGLHMEKRILSQDILSPTQSIQHKRPRDD